MNLRFRLALVFALPVVLLMSHCGWFEDESEDAVATDVKRSTCTYSICDGECVDLLSDHEHCGECFNACSDVGTCFAGFCVR
jgi:hypothetical protein